MARPSNKEELVIKANEGFDKIFSLIESMDVEVRNGTFNFDENTGKEAHWKRDKNLRDVLVHLYEWHQLVLNWVNSNVSGDRKPFIPEPYNWKTYGDMNVEFWKNHQSTSYDEAVSMLNKSHKDILVMLENYSNEELFTKQYFDWTGSSNLGTYFVSATSSHYDWALKKLRKYLKSI